MTIKPYLVENITEEAFTSLDITNNFRILTEQLRQYFNKICSDNNAYSEETSYLLNANASYAFALPESLTHGWDAMYKEIENGKIYFFERVSEQWEDFDCIYMDDLIAIFHSIEDVNVSYT